MTELLILLVIFQIKHFVCDYPLQGQYMLGKMKATGWKLPLAAHAGVHAIATFTVAYLFLDLAYWLDNLVFATVLALADFIIHFTVDRLKASPNLGGRFKPTQPYFWWALGADQMAHHLTHYAIIFAIILL